MNIEELKIEAVNKFMLSELYRNDLEKVIDSAYEIGKEDGTTAERGRIIEIIDGFIADIFVEKTHKAAEQLQITNTLQALSTKIIISADKQQIQEQQ